MSVTELPVPVVGSLSPSRAGDFQTCPLRYRYRVIDKLPEPPSPAAARGTMVHAVLERLFDLPALERTLPAARGLLPAAWQLMRDGDPALAALFGAPAEEAAWLTSAEELLANYFQLEDPSRLAPRGREERVAVVLPSGLRLNGIIDRLDVSPAGDVRVVDYKTGRSPGEGFEAQALFQMKFYALVLWRLHGVVPRVLALLYLGDRQVLRLSPSTADLEATERKVTALWAAIELATRTGDFRPRRSRLCDWCAHQALCPEFGGTVPPLPATGPA